MKKMICTITAMFFIAGCGGGDPKGYLFFPDYPEQLTDFLGAMGARATMISIGGGILSAPAAGVFEDDAWRFDVKPIYDVRPGESLLKVEFLYSSGFISKSESIDIMLCEVILAIPLSGNEIGDPGAEMYNFSIDYDSDGLPNIDELLTGADPMLSDTDGDGVMDGLDAFPSIALEWLDTDGDGVGDNADDDIDGDGLSNEDEMLIGTDPHIFDTDGDGCSDSADICPSISDPSQQDHDGDGIGDACDEDSDGDGLADSNENAIGSDPFNPDTDGDGLGDGAEVKKGSDPLRADTDGDGVSDKHDNCYSAVNPDQSDIDSDKKGDACDSDIDGDGILNAADNCPKDSNADQGDRDADGAGDGCDLDADGDGIPNSADNCPLVANPAQDPGDADADDTPKDCDLDDGDPGVGSESDAIFVDVAHGSDSYPGSRLKPMFSIQAAVRKAVKQKLSVYAAAGEYDVSDLSIVDGTRMYGGFINSVNPSERFASRDVRNDGGSYRTILNRGDIATTIILSEGDAVIDGFHITNSATEFDPVEISPVIVVLGGNPAIEMNVIGGNSSYDSAAVLVAGGGARFDRNLIDGGGRDGFGSRSAGVIAAGGEATFTNNIIKAGSGRFVSGIVIDDGDHKFVNNTVDASSVNPNIGVSEGIVISAASPIIVNNLVMTDVAPDRYPLSCLGSPPSAKARILNNIFANFLEDDHSPIAVDCDGTAYFDGEFQIGEAIVSSNAIHNGDAISDIVDGSYLPIGSGGSADAVDDGLDASADEFANVLYDYRGASRPKGTAYDVGAVEK